MRTILIRSFSFLVFFLVIAAPNGIFAQGQAEYDEIAVFLDVPHLGGTDMTAVIRGEDCFFLLLISLIFLKSKMFLPRTGDRFQDSLLVPMRLTL